MPSNFATRARLVAFVSLVAAGFTLQAQNAFSPGGPDFAVAGARAGDQTAPQAALGLNGGWLVWQDNAADGDGLGINAMRLGTGFTGAGAVFRVNQQGVGDQEKPQVALLSNGGAVVVWQGGRFGFQKIYARVLSSAGVPLGGDILVNTYTNFHQITPAIATLTDGNVIVVWASFNQDGSLLGIYGQRLNAAGQKLGAEFRINQVTTYNQRTPALAALPNASFVVTWVSELQRGSSSVDICARLFGASGNALGAEFAVNTSAVKTCANPAVAATSAGDFCVAWSQNSRTARNATDATATNEVSTTDEGNVPSGWDVYSRMFNGSGSATGEPRLINSMTYGDQFAPKVAAFGQDFLAVWTSLGQDGSREGTFGQFLHRDGGAHGVEFRVNTTTISRQIHSTLATDGSTRFLVVWSTFNAGTSFDLMGRAYELIRAQVRVTPQGVELAWNTQPGNVYQVQASSDLGAWNNFGTARIASGWSDAIVIPPSAAAEQYRVVRVP